MERERIPWTAHGKYKTKLYTVYRNMKQRCLNPNNKAYQRYGGRGITICEEWLGKNGFMTFYRWAIENGYSEGLSIDRENNDGNYTPDNCRWVDSFVQNNNFSRNRKYTYNGETHSLSEWGRLKPNGLGYETLRSRLRDGWSVDDAFSKSYTGDHEDKVGTLITVNGETHNVTWWCRKTGIDKSTFYRRLKNGWSKERAATEPSHEKHINHNYRSNHT